MRLLLDTHVLLWAAGRPEKLGDVRHAVEDARNQLLVSAASSWEIAIKYAIGRLPLPEGPAHYVPALLGRLGATPLAIEHTHALAVAALPTLHRDPFDRLLIAQARALRIPIVTADAVIDRYEVEVIWAGDGEGR